MALKKLLQKFIAIFPSNNNYVLINVLNRQLKSTN